ncbi:NAD(P)H-binding protein [Alkalibacterium olivapovliticus]|uniref:Putative NAD(P)-binding protein n=1 Tax=Alkalibacterium olivapovliticus TaxID=99907 RepID=A0A2T0VWW1_9LACT|nr:NAD(P)H-binding protein [Alkalibacterium olivapovliticus]PRY76514.1 putative NAD(P)-binding protein [Alkalibacterium olivapovliticus]
MKFLILGAAGQIAEKLTDTLLKETDHDVVLYARNGKQRIIVSDSNREEIIEGDFLDTDLLSEAMKNVDAVYLNDMGNAQAVKNVIKAMKNNDVKRIIGASILGIYNEVGGEFGEWNNAMIGSSPRMEEQKKAAQLIETSDLDYTLLRLTWLYNDSTNLSYQVTKKGEPFIGAQVTREAVARTIADIIEDHELIYNRESLGISEIGSEKLDKPSFY